MGYETSLFRTLVDAPEYLEKKKQERARLREEKALAEERLKQQKLSTQILEARAASQPDPELVRQLKEIEIKNKLMADTIGKQQLWAAFDATDKDGNLDRITKTIKNPFLSPIYEDVARLEHININDPTDVKLLQQEGLSPEVFKANPELHKTYWKAIDKSGEVELFDSQAWKVRVGYFSEYKDTEQSKEILARVAEEKRKAEKAILKLRIKELQVNRRESQPESKTRDLRYLPASEKRAKLAEEAEESLKDLFNVDLVEDIDFSDPKNRSKARKYIRSIESNTGRVDRKDKDFFSDMAGMIELSKKAGNLKEEDTGIVDNFLKKLGVYVFDEANESTEARAAWQTFSNTVIHAFAGSAMTAGEVKRHDASFGTASMQTKPLLAKMKVILNKMKAEIKQKMDFYEPAVMSYYVGSNYNKLNKVIEALDERLNFIDKYDRKEGETEQDYVKRRAKQVNSDMDKFFGFDKPDKNESKENELDEFFDL